METMALGLLAVVVLLVSGCCLRYRKTFWSIVGSIVVMALTCLTGHSWKLMLIGSGKDPTLLGFNRYPAAPVILAILLLTALAVIIASVVGIAKQNKGKNGCEF